MTATIATWWNSLAVRIPKNEARRVGIIAGSRVKFSSSGDGIVIRPVWTDDRDFAHLLTHDQLQTLSKIQYQTYTEGLSPIEKEEIWRREDREENISNAFLENLQKEGDVLFSLAKPLWK